MKLNAVAVSSEDLKKSAEFYSIIGFKFPELKEGDDHLESIVEPGQTKLMIDSKKLMTELIGEVPRPGNTSSFAIEYDNANELDLIVEKLKSSGFVIKKEPWDAFWGQRYAVVMDPGGYSVDLYSKL